MSETIVDYNGHHVRIGSPLDARLRKQDENYRDAVTGASIDLPLVDDGKTKGKAKAEPAKTEGGKYADLKAPELNALLAEREIDVPADAKSNKAKIALLEAADAAAGDGDGTTLE